MMMPSSIFKGFEREGVGPLGPRMVLRVLCTDCESVWCERWVVSAERASGGAYLVNRVVLVSTESSWPDLDPGPGGCPLLQVTHIAVAQVTSISTRTRHLKTQASSTHLRCLQHKVLLAASLVDLALIALIGSSRTLPIVLSFLISSNLAVAVTDEFYCSCTGLGCRRPVLGISGASLRTGECAGVAGALTLGHGQRVLSLGYQHH